MSNDNIEKKIEEMGEHMRKFGHQVCYNCNKELHVDYHTFIGNLKGTKYYCLPCGDRS